MNNTFSLKRFGFLFKKVILERPMQIIGVMVLLLILSLILYAVAKRLAGFNAAQNLTFIWGLSGGGFLLASFVFGYFSTNASGASYLTLPASYFEKWLCGILIVGVIYPFIFLLFYHLVDISFVASYHNSIDPSSPFYKEQYDAVDSFDINSIIAWKVYVMFFFLTGSMFIGSFYFNKIAFIKTGILICIFCISIYGLNWLIAKMFFGNINDAGVFNHVTIPVGNEEGSIILPSNIQNIFYYSIWYVLPAILWLLSLTRLKEKEF